MSHILDLQISEVPAELPAGLTCADPFATEPARMSFRTGRSTATIQTEPPRPIGTPEQQLWSGVMLGLYREIANGGPQCRAMRDIAEEGMQDLESIASQLNMPDGFLVKLIAAGIEEFGRRKRKKQIHVVSGRKVA